MLLRRPRLLPSEAGRGLPAAWADRRPVRRRAHARISV